MNINGKIAELVLRIQNASDGGKNLRFFEESQKSQTDNRAGYRQKDKLILESIRLIAKNSGDENRWKFAVARDTEGVSLYIVYFQTRIEGEKVQVSFHSFDRSLERFVKNSHRIKWDYGDSRDSAVYAYGYYIPNGKYV